MTRDINRVSDGWTSLEAGQDSGRVPNLIQRNQCSFAVNTTMRGGFPTHRPGWKKIPFTFSAGTDSFVANRFQTAGVYSPDFGTAFLIAQIGGRQYKVSIGGKVQDISISGNLNSSLLTQAWSVQAENFFVIQDGVTKPFIYNGASARRAGVNEIPVGTRMAVGMGRLWVARGREYIAGDIVGGPSGSATNGFRDSIIKFTENLYLAEGGSFTVPLQSGEITGMLFRANLNTALGQGELVIGTQNGVFTTIVPADRLSWKNTREPLQRIVQLNNGVCAQDSMVLINEDLWFRSLRGLQSLIVAVRNFEAGWGNTPMSKEMNRVIKFDDDTLLGYGSGVFFDNRFLHTVSPVNTEHGVYHRGLAVLDTDLISSMQNRGQPAWEGVWTGVNILKILTGRFDGVERCFAFVLSCGNQIELWELSKDLKFDFPTEEPKRIEWFLESGSLAFGNFFDLKRLNSADVTFDNLVGEADVDFKFRPDQHPFWVDWHGWTMCSTYRKCELEPCEQPKTYANQYRPKVILPQPPDTCSPILGVPYRNGYEFQFRVAVTGSLRVKQFRANAYVQQENPQGECPQSETCKEVTGCGENPFTYSACGGDTPCVSPTISVQPQGQEITEGQSATLSVTATGDSPLLYQWYLDDAEIDGATASSYTIDSATEADAGTYTVEVSNACGSVTSENAVVTFNTECVPGTVDTLEIGDIFSNAPTTFGVQPAGSYRLEYIEGAMQYLGGTTWKLNGSSDHGFRVVHSGGTEVEGPGAGDYGTVIEFASQADVETYYAGAFIDFTHTGGEIYFYLQDDPYVDNVAGTPNPTFRLIRICPL